MKGKSGSAGVARRKNIIKSMNKERFLERKKMQRRKAGIKTNQEMYQEANKSDDKHKEKYHENILERFK